MARNESARIKKDIRAAIKIEIEAERLTTDERKKLDEIVDRLSSFMPSDYSRADANRDMGFSNISAFKKQDHNVINNLRSIIRDLEKIKNNYNKKSEKLSKRILKIVKDATHNGWPDYRVPVWLSAGQKRDIDLSKALRVHLNTAVEILGDAISDLQMAMVDSCKLKIDTAINSLKLMLGIISNRYDIEKKTESGLRRLLDREKKAGTLIRFPGLCFIGGSRF